MFTVDEPTAEAIRRAYKDGGELAGVVQLRRHDPLLADDAHARLCARAIAGWKPVSGGAFLWAVTSAVTGIASLPGARAARRRRGTRLPRETEGHRLLISAQRASLLDRDLRLRGEILQRHWRPSAASSLFPGRSIIPAWSCPARRAGEECSSHGR